MTYSDSVWPADAPTGESAPVGTAGGTPLNEAVIPLGVAADLNLPPLPTLLPLPALRPMSPMPGPDQAREMTSSPAKTTPHGPTPLREARRPSLSAPPPPVGHPAARSTADPKTADTPASPAATRQSAEPDNASTPSAPELRHSIPGDADDSSAPAGRERASIPRLTPATTSNDPGRHASADVHLHGRASGGHSVLVIGGAEPLGSMIAERLLAAGHRLAVQDVEVHSEDRSAPEPVVLSGDRTDTEEIVHTVAGAEIALGGLDAVVIVPGAHDAGTGIDGDASAWADGWSQALAGDVLAATCAAHTAARSFLTRRRAGRIIFVTSGGSASGGTSMHAAVTATAIGTFGAELARELGPHGIGVSVVTAAGHGGLQQFGVGQVADVVDALLATPILSGMTASISSP